MQTKSERRRYRRYDGPVKIGLFLEGNWRTFTLPPGNLSVGGVLVPGCEASPGTNLEVRLDDVVELLGVVKHQTEGGAGIEFKSTDPAQLGKLAHLVERLSGEELE